MDRRERVLAYIVEYIEANGMSPSLREIANGCEIPSISVVNYHLRRLEADGRIVRSPVIARSIRVVATDEDSGPVPSLAADTDPQDGHREGAVVCDGSTRGVWHTA